jgi:hypothetical protein
MPTSKRATASTLLALLLGFGLMQTGNTLQSTLLSVRGGIEGFSPAQIGAVGAPDAPILISQIMHQIRSDSPRSIT